MPACRSRRALITTGGHASGGIELHTPRYGSTSTRQYPARQHPNLIQHRGARGSGLPVVWSSHGHDPVRRPSSRLVRKAESRLPSPQLSRASSLRSSRSRNGPACSARTSRTRASPSVARPQRREEMAPLRRRARHASGMQGRHDADPRGASGDRQEPGARRSRSVYPSSKRRSRPSGCVDARGSTTDNLLHRLPRFSGSVARHISRARRGWRGGHP